MAELTDADLKAKKKIYGLNLTNIVICTRRQQSWTEEKAKDAERWYKHFLWMCYMNGRRPLAIPGSEADEVWHNHILDTVNYRRVCDDIFGGYLDHQALALDGEPTAEQIAAIETTRKLSSELLVDEVMPDSITPCGCPPGGGTG